MVIKELIHLIKPPRTWRNFILLNSHHPIYYKYSKGEGTEILKQRNERTIYYIFFRGSRVSECHYKPFVNYYFLLLLFFQNTFCFFIKKVFEYKINIKIILSVYTFYCLFIFLFWEEKIKRRERWELHFRGSSSSYI